jgi:non-heme chloroperoxidase
VSTVTLASGIALSYVRQGRAVDPAVLLLPGPTDSWRSYERVLAHLPSEIQVIAVSQRGHGDSDKPESGYGVEDFAADVVRLLDALEIEQAVLAGHSGSCLVARRVALDQPHRVAALVLEASPSSLRDHPQLIGFVDSIVPTLEDPIAPEFARAFLTQTSATGLARDYLDLLVQELLKVPSHVWKETFSALLEYDDLAELTRIATPTLLIWGDADSIVSRDTQEVLVRSIPHADLLVYHGVGHTPRWEDAERFSRDLTRFATQVATTGV